MTEIGLAPLDACFATRIPGVRAFRDEGDDEPWTPWRTLATLPLPFDVKLHVVSGGALVYDFSANKDFCGGMIAAPVDMMSPAYKKRFGLLQRRADYMNAFAATIYHGGQPTFAFDAPLSVTAENYLDAKLDSSGEFEIGGYDSKGRDCSANAIKKAADAFQNIVQPDPLFTGSTGLGQKGITLLALLQKAALHFTNHEFPSSLILSWTIAEALVNQFFLKLISNLESAKKTIFNGIRKELLAGRDYTASVMSQMLSFNGVITDQMLDILNTSRKKRNDFAHKLDDVEWEDASAALNLAAQMISKKAGFQLAVPISFSWRS